MLMNRGMLMKPLIALHIFLVMSVAGRADDPATWTPNKIPGHQKAPEFTDIFDWINSKPLTIADLKGKVVVIHFMAFG